jgi:hypothetical protein
MLVPMQGRPPRRHGPMRLALVVVRAAFILGLVVLFVGCSADGWDFLAGHSGQVHAATQDHAAPALVSGGAILDQAALGTSDSADDCCSMLVAPSLSRGINGFLPLEALLVVTVLALGGPANFRREQPGRTPLSAARRRALLAVYLT